LPSATGMVAKLIFEELDTRVAWSVAVALILPLALVLYIYGVEKAPHILRDQPALTKYKMVLGEQNK
jgi:hypothetical protein